MAKATKQQKLLEHIKTETAKGPEGFAMVERNALLQALLDSHQVVINENIVDGELIAARYQPESDTHTNTVVPNGVAHEGIDGEKMETMEEIVQTIDGKEVVRGLMLPEPKRGGTKKEEWPWSKMEVGDSFLVPVTDKYPEPWISFQSNVASNVRRFAELVPGETTAKGNPKKKPTRKFALRKVSAGDSYPNGYVEPSDGARVFRTA